MKRNSTSRSAFFNARLLIGFAVCVVGVLPAALAGQSRSAIGAIATSAAGEAPGTWEVTGSLATPRDAHTATLLPNGQVLVAGGFDATGTTSESAELYDPVTGRWTATGSMATARASHTATLLPNGQVLVAGGFYAGGSAELYDPATGQWTATRMMKTYHAQDTATLLPNGKVLVAGGVFGNGSLSPSAELYDPATGLWTKTGNLN